VSFSFNWSAYGDLNPVSQKTFGARYDSQVSTYEDMSREIQESHYSSDALSKRVDWIGVVLRVEGRTTEPNNFLDASDEQPRRRTHIRIKVRVPELHAQISEPRSPKDHYVIDMHPTYTAAHNRLPVPRVGDRVLVSHLGAENLDAPIYKDYLEDKAGRLNLGRTKRSSRNCLEYAPGQGCLQRKAGSDGKIDVSLFPAPRGSLKPKSSNSSAFLFGDSQMVGQFGQVFETYLKHHGWAIKRKARSGSAVRHWRKPGKTVDLKPNPPGFELKGFLDDGLATNPELVIISLGGNSNYGSSNPPGSSGYKAWKKEFITKTIDLAKQCLGSSKTVMWFGCPPTVANKSSGFKVPRHDWDQPGYWNYRENVNLVIEEALKTFSEYDKTLFFINPIGSANDNYAGKDHYLPNYQSPGGDGVHLTTEAALEYVKKVASEERGMSLTSTKSAAPGPQSSKSPKVSIDPVAALFAAKKEKDEILQLPEAERDQERLKELDRDIKKYEKMPKAISTKQREEYVEKLSKINEEINIKTEQLMQMQEKGEDTTVVSEQLDNLQAEAEAIEELLEEDDKASKPVPCDPCTPGTRNTKNRHETEPLALNWEEAKKDGNKNATKYIRAFMRMIVIGEGGRKSHSGISPYQLCVGGDFVLQRAQNGLPKYTNANEATRLGPKSPVGNSFVGYEGGHPRLLFKWSDRFTGRVDENGKSLEWKNNSTAAGRYQFMEGTWFGKNGKPGWGKLYTSDENDFSPLNQDRCVANFLASQGIKRILEEGGENFVSPEQWAQGGRDFGTGRDTRPPTIQAIPEVGAKPTNMFEQQFFLAVKKIRKIWASLPGAGYEGQHTSKKATVFLDYYKFSLAQEMDAEEAGKDTSKQPVAT